MTWDEAITIAQGEPEYIVELLPVLTAGIEELERKVAQLTTDSSNSSKPPSSDGPAKKAQPVKPKSPGSVTPEANPAMKEPTAILSPSKKLMSWWRCSLSGVKPVGNPSNWTDRPRMANF